MGRCEISYMFWSFILVERAISLSRCPLQTGHLDVLINSSRFLRVRSEVVSLYFLSSQLMIPKALREFKMGVFAIKAIFVFFR